MVPPPETSEKFANWETENSMIMSWLLGSMTPEVSNTFMLYQTAADIWKATKKCTPREITFQSYMSWKLNYVT